MVTDEDYQSVINLLPNTVTVEDPVDIEEQ